MRRTVRVMENDERYEVLKKIADIAMDSGNAIIVARGKGNQKEGIKPLMRLNDIAFYAAFDIASAVVYKAEVDEWEPDTSLPIQIYVLTNDTMQNGAGILFCTELLHKIWEKAGNYILIPSSIHELLIVPDPNGNMDKDYVSAMVRTVNGEEVSEEDQLSDTAFYYDGKLN